MPLGGAFITQFVVYGVATCDGWMFGLSTKDLGLPGFSGFQSQMRPALWAQQINHQLGASLNRRQHSYISSAGTEE